MSLLGDMKAAYKKGAEEQRQIFAMRREKAADLMHLTDTLESLTGSRDINAPLRMAVRLMAVGIDPKDHETVGTIAEAYAMGKYEHVPVGEKEFAKSLESVQKAEEKKQ